MKPFTAGRAAYNRKKWSILFIGEEGKVVTVKHFKGIVAGLTAVLTALVLAVMVLSYQFQHRAERIEKLRRGMAGVEEENSSLKDEKDRMLARLVILESQLKALEKEKAAGKAGKPQKEGEPVEKAAKEPAPAPSTEKEETKPQAVAKSQAAASQTQWPPVTIANKNLIVCQDPNSESMRVEYKVINTGPKDTPAAGRSVIILKGDNMNAEDWIVLPNVPLLDLKPAGERGKRFRIYNFRTLKYMVELSAVKGRLETATIYTFTVEGELLMERDYPLEMAAEMCP